LSGNPATYTLTLTPQNGFSGTVVLNCVPITPAQYASCSLLPTSIALAGSAQNAVATITSVTSLAPASGSPQIAAKRRSAIMLCVLLPGALFFLRRREPHTMKLLLWLMIGVLLMGIQSCGSSRSEPFLRVSPAGSYQYQVTASSTSGVQITQTVTLNLVLTQK